MKKLCYTVVVVVVVVVAAVAAAAVVGEILDCPPTITRLDIVTLEEWMAR